MTTYQSTRLYQLIEKLTKYTITKSEYIEYKWLSHLLGDENKTPM
ncbi:MAG: hypothetical protein ACI9LM_000932 [Alteromonadaceae bacterium]|jgi:hypothetical protein